MRKWIKVTATAAFMAAGVFTLGAGAAHADVQTSGNGAVGSGNQIVGELNAPINVSGNAVGAVGGLANADASGAGASAHNPGHGEVATSGDGSVLSGNQLVADVNVPVNVCGNAVAVGGGLAGASCEEGSASVE